MNLESIIKEKEREFETRYCWSKDKSQWAHVGMSVDDFKSFLRESLTEVAKEAIEAVRLEEKKLSGYLSNPDDASDAGYNSAVSEMKTKADNFLIQLKNN